MTLALNLYFFSIYSSHSSLFRPMPCKSWLLYNYIAWDSTSSCAKAARFISVVSKILDDPRIKYSHCENCDENIGLLIEYLTNWQDTRNSNTWFHFLRVRLFAHICGGEKKSKYEKHFFWITFERMFMTFHLRQIGEREIFCVKKIQLMS